jgi:RNA polymerase sigma-70 factor (ECF subfamily)
METKREVASPAESGAERPGSKVPDFREVHDSCIDFVCRYAIHRGVSPVTLDDAVQEVFIVVHERLGTFEGRSSIKTWVGGIARLVVNDHLRKRKNRALGEPLLETELPPSDAPDPSELTARSEAARQLDELLAKMSEVQREVFVLCEIEQLSSVEVAEMLGVNENTIRTRLREARKSFEAGVNRFRTRAKREGR